MGIIKERLIVDRYSKTAAAIDENGAVKVHASGELSTLNSSSTPLAADAVYIGSAENLLNESVLIVTVYSDVASATDGLMIQWSPDGTNWDGSDVFTIPAATQKTFTFQPVTVFFRVSYTNGGTDQTAFRLQTQLKSTYVKPSSHRIADELSNQDDAEVIKAVISGENGDGLFHNVKTTADGNLTISDNSSGLAIAEGNVSNTTYIHKFGGAPDFDTADGEVTIWDGADDSNIDQMVYQYSTTAAIDSISSSNSGDTQDIKIQGLDADFNLITQTVTLNGQTRVALSTPLIRAFRGKNDNSTDLAGHVYVYENTTLSSGVPIDSTKVRLVIQPGFNQTLMALYTIPAGVTGYMRDWYASTAGASKDSQYIIKLWAREYDDTAGSYKAWQLKHVTSISDVGTSYIQHKYEEPEKFEAKVDIRLTVEATAVGATGASVAGGFDIVLVDV